MEQNGYCLKRSVLKKSARWQFAPTNMNVQLLHCRSSRSEADDTPENDDTETFSTITFGCTAAHAYGYANGGLRRMQHQARWVFQSPRGHAKPCTECRRAPGWYWRMRRWNG